MKESWIEAEAGHPERSEVMGEGEALAAAADHDTGNARGVVHLPRTAVVAEGRHLSLETSVCARQSHRDGTAQLHWIPEARE